MTFSKLKEEEEEEEEGGEKKKVQYSVFENRTLIAGTFWGDER